MGKYYTGTNDQYGQQDAFLQYLEGQQQTNPYTGQQFDPENIQEPINTFDASQSFKDRLKKQRQTISPIRQYENDTLQYDITTGTGKYDFNPYMKGLNTLAQGATFLANQKNEVDQRREERNRYLQALMPKPQFNQYEDGLNNIPIYKEGGKQNPPKIYTDRKQFERAQRMYNDSLDAYNKGKKVLEIPLFQKGGKYNQPTTSDSLNVYNSQKAVNNFYDNEVKNGRLKQDIIDSITPATDLIDMLRLSNENLDFYRTQIKRREDNASLWDDLYESIFNISPAHVSKLEYEGLGKTKSGNKYQQYYRDLVTPLQNLKSPFALVDSRIKPRAIIHYGPTRGSYPGGIVDVYDYDIIAVKPAHMKTVADWKYMNKTYGTKIPNVTQSQNSNSTQYPGKLVPKSTHPIQKMSRINPQQMDLSSQGNIQGQQVPFPQFQLPQQKGNPVYGPGNTIVGYSDNMNFKPAYQYTGSPNNQLNLQDKELINNPEALKKYLQSKDNYKFSAEEFKKGGKKESKQAAAWRILREDKDAHGNKLTPKQKKFFLAMGRAKYEDGGFQNDPGWSIPADPRFENMDLGWGIPGDPRFQDMDQGWSNPAFFPKQLGKQINGTWIPQSVLDRMALQSNSTNSSTGNKDLGWDMINNWAQKAFKNPRYMQSAIAQENDNDWHHNVDDIPFPESTPLTLASMYGVPQGAVGVNQLTMTPLERSQSKYFPIDEDSTASLNHSMNSNEKQQMMEYSFTPVRTDYNKKYIPYKQYANGGYTVQKGDNLTKIAQKFNIPLRDKLYNTGNPADRYASYGCVNCQRPDFEKHIRDNFSPGDSLLILNSNKSYNDFQKEHESNRGEVKKRNTNIKPTMGFKNGGAIEGQELDLTQEQIRELQKQGYKFEIL